MFGESPSQNRDWPAFIALACPDQNAGEVLFWPTERRPMQAFRQETNNLSGKKQPTLQAFMQEKKTLQARTNIPRARENTFAGIQARTNPLQARKNLQSHGWCLGEDTSDGLNVASTF